MGCLKISIIIIAVFMATVGYGQKVDLGLYPLASLTSQSINYKKSKCNYINTIDVHPGETNTYWSDAYLFVSYKPIVEFFNSSLGNFRFYEDFLGSSGAGITGSVTATWRINGNGTHHITHTTSIVYHSFNEEHDLLLSPPIFPDNKEYFGKACEEIKTAGGICNREELARRGYAPQLIELKFDVTISGVEYVEQKLEQLKKRKDLIEQGTVLYSQGKCTEAVPLFKEALKVVTDQKLKNRLGLNENDADIQFKIDDCEKKIGEEKQDFQNYQNNGSNSPSGSNNSSNTTTSNSNSGNVSNSNNAPNNTQTNTSNNPSNSNSGNISNSNNAPNNTQTPNQFNNTPAPVYDSKEWEKFNQMQQNVNQWNQDWYSRIEQNEQQRLQKQAMYEQAGEQIGRTIGNFLNELEQRKQREEIAKKQKRINRAVSGAFSSVKAESDYWSGFASDLLNVVNKYSKNLDKTAYDEIESSLNAIKRTLDEIGKEHNSLQEKLRKDWDYADNDPRRFRVSYWEDYSFRKEAYIDFYQTFTVGSRISDKTIRCNFVNDLLPLINKHAERRQSTYHITSIEQAYIASGCKNYSYESLLKSAKAIEAYEKMRDEKTKQIQALQKKVEEELVKIKVLESIGVKVENISNQYQIEGVDLSDLKNEYNLLKGNSGAFENELKKLNPDNLIKAYGGANTGSLVFKPSGIYVAPGTFEVTLSREFSSPKEHKVTLNAQKGQKTLTINPMDYDSVFEFDARFKPYKVVLAKYQKKNSFGKMYWLVPEFKFYTSGIIEFNLTPLGFIKSYNPKGFYRGRPVFIHKINFLGLSVSKINLINGFVTSDSSSRYKLHSDFTSFGIDIMRYEAGFTQPLFNGRSELRLFAGATSPIRFFSVNQKEEFSVPTSPFDFEEGSYNRWFGGITIYPRIEFVSHIGKTMIEFGYAYNFILFFDDLETYTESEKLKSQIGQDELYQKYLPLNNFKNLLTHEFSVRFIF